LGRLQAILASGSHDLQPAIGSILDRVLVLLDRRRQPTGGGQDPQLDEAHRLQAVEWSCAHPTMS
jgi:hypothetical protein